MAVKFSEFSIGAIGANLELVGYDSNTLSNVQVGYSELKIDILAGAVTGTGAAGRVAYWTGASSQSGSNNLFWDNVNGWMGIGTNVPARILDIVASGNSPQVIRINNTTNDTAASSGIEITSGARTGSLFMTSPLYTGFGALTAGSLGFYTAAAGANIVMAVNSSGYFSIGTQTPIPVEKFRLTNIGNVILQNGGTFSDSGQRLQVIGDTFLKGSGATGATNALFVQNSLGSSLFNVVNTGTVYIYGTLFTGTNIAGQGTNLTIEPGSSGGKLILKAFATTGSNVNINGTTPFTHTNQDVTSLLLDQAFSPTSGTGLQTYIRINPTINQTGGANGITRGLFIQPTLTAVADWRAIEVSAGISVLAPSTTASATLRIPSGTAPTSPTNGDIWFDGTNLFMRIGGVTKTFTIV